MSKIPLRLQAPLCRYIGNISVDRVLLLNALTIRGVRYTIHTKHFGNSCALIKFSSDNGIKVPAVIDAIFRINSSADAVETFLAVRRYEALPSNGGFDFHVIGASIWSSKLGDLEIIKPGSIDSHYASLSFHSAELGPAIAVISLSRDLLPIQQDEDSDMVDLALALNDLSL